jgi:hypothetical protein
MAGGTYQASRQGRVLLFSEEMLKVPKRGRAGYEPEEWPDYP